MNKISLLKKIRAAAGDPERVGDLAIYKSELTGMRARPEVEAELVGLAATFPDVAVEPLSRLPRGTLGREYAQLLADAELQPFRISDRLERELLERNIFTARYALMHDVFHVLTGFDTSWAGEAGVWAFVAAQGYARSHWVAVALACVIYPVIAPSQTLAVWRNVRRGARMGRHARSLMAVRFEERWDARVAELRAELGVEPVDELGVRAVPAEEPTVRL